MQEKPILAFVKKHPYKCLGTLLGTLVGVLLVSIGVWKTLVILLMLGVGLLVGARLDSGRSFRSIISKITRPDEE